jgi:sialate O-acetylesterase
MPQERRSRTSAVVFMSLVLLIWLAPIARAALSIAPIFGSNMVLQRNATVPVFGTGDAGATVSVQFQNQNALTVVPVSGKWVVNLASMAASAAPSTMTVTSGASTVTFTAVQVGEVWVMSGQSNMDMALSEADEGSTYAADAPNRNIRLFLMKAGNGPATATWKVANATTAAAFSAVGWWSGLELARTLNVPIGLIQATHDGTNISQWQTTNGGTGADYLAMVKAIQPFAIKGVGWYQGESNGGDSAYETKLTAMISEWRADWGMASLPFGIVQLPSSKWDAARSAQFNVTTKVANTFLVVTSDLPQSSQLHPTVKKPVGQRLGIGMRGFVYGEAIEYSGPVRAVPPSSFVSGNKVVLNFTHLGNGLITSNGAAPAPCQVAAADGRFQSATATIVGNTVEISSARVSAPKRVRYGFGGQGNLMNVVNVPVEGGAATITRLPASLFELAFP